MGRLIKFSDFEIDNKDTEETIPNPSGRLPEPQDIQINSDEEPEEDLEEQKLTNKAQDYVSRKIAALKGEGYEDAQAAAIAFSMAKKRGFDVNKNEEVEEVEEVPVEDAEEQKIKTVNEKKPNPHNNKKFLKDRNELIDSDDSVEEMRPLDALYITDMIKGYASELMDDEPEVAMELRQVARSMKAQYPNNRDISVEDVYEIAEEQGIEDDEILQKVKDEIKYMWAQA